jgi:hypothetical protein
VVRRLTYPVRMSDNQEPAQFKRVDELTVDEHHTRLMTGKLPETPEWIEEHADDDAPPAIEQMTTDQHLKRIRRQR